MRTSRRVYASITPADLPSEIVALLYMLVDLPFALRATCKALRDAKPDGTIKGPMLSRLWDGYKTKTALVDVVKDVRLLAWACASGCLWLDRLAILAARAGREEAINYLCEFQGHEWDMEVVVEAALGGHLETLKWLHEKKWFGDEWDYEVCNAAASRGHIEVLRFAFENGCPFSNRGLNDAARGGHHECVEYMLAQNEKDPAHWRPYHCHAAEHAALGGHIRVLALLQKHRVPISFSATKAAAGAVGSGCFLFLVNGGCPWREWDCFEEAAGAGNLGALGWIIDKATAPVTFPCHLLVALAHKGRLEVLQLAHGMDPADFQFHNEYLCEGAASGGHLETLQWLHRVECPFGTTVLEQAADGGHVHVLEWLWGQEGIEHHHHSFNGAISNGHIPALEWAMENGVLGPWTEGSVSTLPERAAHLGNLDVVKWAVSLGHELSPYTVYRAAARNQVHVLRWLVEEAGVSYDSDRLGNLVCSKAAVGGTATYIRELERQRGESGESGERGED